MPFLRSITENQFLKDCVEDTKTSKIKVNPNSKDGIIYFKVIHPDYYERKISQAAIENGIIELARKGVTEEFCIKLATLKKEAGKG